MPTIPEGVLNALESESVLFRKIIVWLNGGGTGRCAPGFENAVRTVLDAFRSQIPEVPFYRAAVEDLSEAFSRVDLGGYSNPLDEDFADDWFAVSFESPAESVFVSRTGKLRRAGLREALLWVKRYSLVPAFDFSYVEETFDLLYPEDFRCEFEDRYPASLRKLEGVPNPCRLPRRMPNQPFYELRKSFESYQGLLKEWDSIFLDLPHGALPKYVIRTIDESTENSHDLMRDAWDRLVADCEQECAVYFGFFQLGVDMRTAKPEVFVGLLREIARNFSALKEIMFNLEDR